MKRHRSIKVGSLRNQTLSTTMTLPALNGSGSGLFRSALCLVATLAVVLPLQNCSNGASTFTDAPPSVEATEIHSTYLELSKSKDFQSSVDNVLESDEPDNIVDTLNLKGKKFTNLKGNLKKLLAKAKHKARKNFKAFLDSEKNLGEVQARDFDLVSKFYFDGLNALSTGRSATNDSEKYTRVDSLRAIRAGAILRAMANLSETQNSTSEGSSAKLQLWAAVAGRAIAGAAARGGGSGGGNGIDLEKLAEATSKVMGAAGGFGKDVANAHYVMQSAKIPGICGDLLGSCRREAEQRGLISDTDNNIYKKQVENWQQCENDEPAYTCTYGEARSKQLRPGNEKFNCQMFKIWECHCNGSDEKNADGSYKHSDSDKCENAPNSRHELNTAAYQAAKPQASVPPPQAAGIGDACLAYHANCK